MDANLTLAMRSNRVKHVTDLGTGFAVHLHGGAYGTGPTVGEALASAKAMDATLPKAMAA